MVNNIRKDSKWNEVKWTRLIWFRKRRAGRLQSIPKWLLWQVPYGTFGREQACMHVYGKWTPRNYHLGKAQLYMESNVRMNNKKWNVVTWIGLILLRTDTADRALSMLKWSFPFLSLVFSLIIYLIILLFVSNFAIYDTLCCFRYNYITTHNVFANGHTTLKTPVLVRSP